MFKQEVRIKEDPTKSIELDYNIACSTQVWRCQTKILVEVYFPIYSHWSSRHQRLFLSFLSL